MRPTSILIGMILTLICSTSSADIITLNGTDYETDGTTTTATHGFVPGTSSTAIAFDDDRYIRISAQSLNGFIGGPGIQAGTFFTTIGYRQDAELLVYKTGFAPKRASELFVYNLITDTPLTPNGSPTGQVNSLVNTLHDFVIDANLLSGPTSNYSLQLSMGEAFFNITASDNGGQSTYKINTLNEVTAVPEPSSFALIGTVAACLGGWRLRQRKSVSIENDKSDE